jgi:hypothetical protein
MDDVGLESLELITDKNEARRHQHRGARVRSAASLSGGRRHALRARRQEARARALRQMAGDRPGDSSSVSDL